MSNILSTKQALHQYCCQDLRKRIESIKATLASIEESRNNETKSSVGDKYETGRAMIQLEEEKCRTQLANAQHLSNILDAVDPTDIKHQVELGSLVITNAGKYFIVAGLGKINLNGDLYYAISVDAPITQALLRKQVGDLISFNQKEIKILAIS